MTEVLEAARAMVREGLCVVPIRTDGTKVPAVEWKGYQSRTSTPVEVERWFGNGSHYSGLGLICGKTSGGLEMLELEGRAVAEGYEERLGQRLVDHGLGELWERLTTGYREVTPSGGVHLLFRVTGAEPLGNRKLARRPSTQDELHAAKVARVAVALGKLGAARAAGNVEEAARQEGVILATDKLTAERIPQVLIETRGEGGFVVTAPSNGTTHDSRKAWRLTAGSIETIPTLTAAERDTLYALAETFDSMPARTTSTTGRQGPGPVEPAGGNLSPGDDFNARADWLDIIGAAGWDVTSEGVGGYREWRHPGAHSDISATTGRNEADQLWVFSTSTEFEAEVSYTKFGAYAVLHHGGNHSEAARALRKLGYGSRAEPSSTPGVQPSGNDFLMGRAPAAQPAAGAAPPTTPTAAPAAPAPAPSDHYSLTDDGNATWYVDSFGSILRANPYDRANPFWRWADYRWVSDEAGVTTELARTLVRTFEASDPDPETAKARKAHKKRSLGKPGLEAMLSLASKDQRIVMHPTDFDSHHEALCTPGGVVDLRTGAVSAPDPSSYHLRSTALAPDFEMPTPMWDRFLDTTFQGKRDLIGYVQRLAGYAATGRTHVHIFPFLYGPKGQNGKSMLVKTVVGLLGSYAVGKVHKGFIVAQYDQPHDEDYAALRGLRFGVLGEVNKEDRFDEDKIKSLTGGDPIRARHLYGKPFTFDPTHKLWMHANEQPAITNGGPAFGRRLRLIPFEHRVPDAQVIEDIDKLLIAREGPGILAWIIRGAVDMLRGGLRDPAEVLEATKSYMAEEDALARFIEDECHLATGNLGVKIDTGKFREAYVSWCREQGEDAQPATYLARQLRGRFGVLTPSAKNPGTRSNGRTFYVGITLTRPEQADPRDPD